MNQTSGVVSEQAWSWLDDEPDAGPAPIDPDKVFGVLFPIGGSAAEERCRIAVGEGLVHPQRLVREDDLPEYAAWVWALPDTCEPDPHALEALLDAAARNQAADVIACVSVEPRRRGPATIVNAFGETVSGFGQLRTLAEPGELHQGQLSQTQVLGAPASGMLVQGDLWRYLNGFNQDLAPQLWGLDFGWRANLCGAIVVVEPDAKVVDNLPQEGAGLRAGTLALALANTSGGWRWLAWLKLAVYSLLAAIGFAIGKDMAAAGAELAGTVRFLFGRRLRASVRESYARLKPTQESLDQTAALRPGRFSGLARAGEGVASRFADWLGTYTEQTETSGIDEMMGDDFTSPSSGGRRVPVVIVGILASLILAMVAGWRLFGNGQLRAFYSLPAAVNSGAMFADYLNPVPGSANVAGAPWEALFGLFSWVFADNPDLASSLMVMACVPLAWLGAFRLARQMLDHTMPAVLGAAAYALSPVICGGLGNYGFPLAVWTVLLPVAGYSLWWWRTEGVDRWRGAGAVAVWVLVLVALYPPVWVAVVAVAAVCWARRRGLRQALQWLLVVGAPWLLAIGPWGGALAAYPGRLLTGADPWLAPDQSVAWWRFIIAGLDESVPVWVCAAAVGTLWLCAIVGALRRREALWLLAVAVGAAVAAGFLNRLLVLVPPGQWARPTGVELSVAMMGALASAAMIGLDGFGDDLRERALGWRHLGVFALAVASLGAVAVAAGWWVVGGEAKLVRQPVGSLPAFVVNDQRSATPGRTLAMSVEGDEVAWMLVEGDYPRLGQAETGLVVHGDAKAGALARSVVARLVAGSADDEIVQDLASLGVAHLWLRGAEEDVRMGISNTPGIDLGTGDAQSMVWPVPGSGLAVVVSDAERALTGDGSAVSPDLASRALVLAEPADSRWWATVDGRSLTPLASDGFGQTFELGTSGGVLRYGLDAGPQWWAWAQGAALVALVLLALPGVQAGAHSPRRAVREL
ncbi:MAG: hypothetical protein LBR32_03100 [Propionibacteriaceae bacterium]|nr:hypothetical protein [Propionibacteriaceae bacterium]